MTLESLLIHSVTIYPVTENGTTDRYGNPEAVEGSGVTYPARVQQETSTEDLINRDTRATTYTMFLPPDAAIDALSIVEFDGRRMRVVGEPEVANDGIGPHHIEAALEVFAG